MRIQWLVSAGLLLALGLVLLVEDNSADPTSVTQATPIQVTLDPDNRSFSINGIAFDFVDIPAGSFFMGSNNCGDYAAPIHEVNIAYPFQMGKTEVTVAQFALFAWETGLVTKAEEQGHGGTVDHELWVKHRRLKWIQGQGINWKNPGFKQGPNHPVVLITWGEANAFCDWLSQKTGSTIRLPSETEWEYACRAGDVNEYSECPDEMAWYGANSPGYTHPVAQKKPNAWGLYDILGNVWEMCLDRVNKGYDGAPTDGSPWMTSNIQHTVSTNERRVRGGAYNRQIWSLMYGYRYFNPGRSTNYGFRLVRLPQTGPNAIITPCSQGEPEP